MKRKHFSNLRKAARVVALSLLAIAFGAQAGNKDNPVANPKAVVEAGNARFTVLTPEMIRIEYSDKGLFEDRATFSVINRNLPVPSYKKSEDKDYVYINTPKLALKYRKGTNPLTSPASPDNLAITMNLDGKDVVWYPGKPDPLNLKGTCRTLDSSNGDNRRADMENGVVSRSGWAVIDDSWTTTRADGSRSFALEPNSEVGFDWQAERKDPQALDLYFMGYGKNYKEALSDFTKIAGKIPLPPSYVFGYWYSKFDVYTSDDFRDIVANLAKNDIPCSVMILDVDWHWNGTEEDSDGRGGWTGWSWNTKLIPDAEDLLKELHDKNYRAALNLHPADGVSRSESPEYYDKMNTTLKGKYAKNDTIPWMIDNADFAKSFFNTIIHDKEKEGVDFWWLDWQQHLTSDYTDGLGETFWCNHVFFNDMQKNRPDRRPVIFHRWGGLGCHRYQIGFSGDAVINFPTLAFQPYFTATASNVGYGYWGHDLGGHMIMDNLNANDPELVLRWIQFGVFTPIFRTHATKDPRIERRIWKFPNFPTMREAVNLRYSLFPYIYTMAREAYDTGVSLCRPLYYEFPDDEESYTYENEYMFGNDILVAPITEASVNGISRKEIWFPKGKWWSASTNELIEGPCVKTMEFNQSQIPYFFRQGSMIPFNTMEAKTVSEHPSEIVINVVAGGNGTSSLYEDAFDSQDYSTNYATTALTATSKNGTNEFVIAPRKTFGNGVADLKDARSYTFNIYNSDKPKQVAVNGTATNNFTYEPATRTLTVKVPSVKCDKAVKVAVK